MMMSIVTILSTILVIPVSGRCGDIRRGLGPSISSPSAYLLSEFINDSEADPEMLSLREKLLKFRSAQEEHDHHLIFSVICYVLFVCHLFLLWKFARNHH